MTQRPSGERGSALVMALGVLAVLAVLAIVILTIVTGEKRTAFTEYTSSRSFYSADAAGEAGVNWILHQYQPPPTVDSLSDVYSNNTYITIANGNSYQFNVVYVRKRFRPGWSVDYKDYEYRVEAKGTSAQQSQAAVQVGAVRLYREGY
jgi:Tfp pilus assembly protein PilX